MASMSIQAQPAPQPREPWVSPQEQLRRLALPMVKEHLNSEGLRLVPDALGDTTTEIAIQSILKRSVLAVADSSVPTLFDLAVERLVPPSSTNWYTSLDRLNALPESIPPLPRHIHQILNGKCPIRSEERKPDGTHYKVGDTHSLYLDPFPTIEALEASVKLYGQAHYPRENPLQFRYFWNAARQEHGNVWSNEPQWLLISNDVLPKSRKKSYETQAQMVAELSTKAFVNYEVPSLKAAIAVPFLHNVATGVSLYQAGNNQNGNTYTYTRVQETTQDRRLVVGGFAPVGLHVYFASLFAIDGIGVAALRKF